MPGVPLRGGPNFVEKRPRRVEAQIGPAERCEQRADRRVEDAVEKREHPRGPELERLVVDVASGRRSDGEWIGP